MSRFSRWSKMKSESRSRRGAALPGFAPEAEESPASVVEQEVIENTPPESVAAASAEMDAAAETQAETQEGSYPADLPDIDSLDKDSDYSVFMSDKVSDALRNRALRKLWLSDPVLANVDGLVDYGEDFTDAAMVVKNMQSVYKVGRGMVDYEEEERKKAEAAAELENAHTGCLQENISEGEVAYNVENEKSEDEESIEYTRNEGLVEKEGEISS